MDVGGKLKDEEGVDTAAFHHSANEDYALQHVMYFVSDPPIR